MSTGYPSRRGWLAAAAVALLCACARQHTPPPPRDSFRLHVLEPPDLDPLKVRCLEKIRSAYPSARMYPDHDAWIAAARALHEGGILLVADADFFPVNRLEWLGSFLRSGGRLLLIGPQPFSAGVVQSGKRLLTWNEFACILAPNAVPWLPAWEKWSPLTPATCPAAIESTAGPGGLSGWTFAHLTWTGRVAALETDPADTDHLRPALIFYGRAPAGGGTLSLVAEKTEGNCVRTDIELGDEWKVFCLPLATLRGDTSRRPAGTASSSVPGVRRWIVILAGKPQETHGDQSPPPAIDLSDFRIVELPWSPESLSAADGLMIAALADVPVVSGKKCSLVSPAGKKLVVGGPVGLLPGASPEWKSSFPRLQRLEPIFALDRADAPPGWCGIVCRHRATGGTVLSWGWLGVWISRMRDGSLRRLLDPFLSALQRRAYFVSAGADRMTAGPGGDLAVSVVWMAANPRWAARIRAAAALMDGSRKTLCRRVGEPGEGCLLGNQYPLNFRLPMPRGDISRVSNLSLVCEIADIRQGPEPVDRVVQPILSPANRGQLRERVRAKGPAFRIERRFMPLLAVRYTPSARGCSARGQWLLAGNFDPRLVRYDLGQLAALGLNTVAVTLDDPRQVPQLRYFAQLARRNGLRVIVDLPVFNPFIPDFEAGESLLASLGEDVLSDLCALQIKVSLPENLGRLADLWSAWLTEQYCSPDQAEKLFGSLSLDGHGARRLCRSPLFRRFAADLTLRCSSWLRTELACRNYKGMLGAVCDGLDGDWTIGCLVGTRLLDYVAIRVDMGAGPPSTASAAVRLARGLAGVKPVCFAPVVSPCSSWMAPPRGLVARSFDVVREARAAGILFPESRVPLGRRWKGVALLDCAGKPEDWTADFCQRLRELVTGWVPPGSGRIIEFNPWAEDISLAALFRDLVRRKDAEIRAEGWSRDPPSTRLTSLGGPVRPPCPLDGFNAVWTDIEVNGRPLCRKPFQAVTVRHGDRMRFHLENVGTWEWRLLGRDQGGRVAVLASRSGQPKGRYLEAERGEGGRRSAWFKWTAQAGVWRIRATLDGRIPFGEELTVRVTQTD
ncbi:MAG TPA: hypothetical protein EYP62_01345 [Kiritimatiellae bacterium]|nr:hypothetical protein [Kiritimatiellia bacterium]